MAFPSGYPASYELVTIQSSQIDAALTDFPVTVLLSDLSADIQALLRSDGGDARFTTADGATQLARETLKVGGVAYGWAVKVPSVSDSADTAIRMYANGTDTEPAVTGTYGRNAVWSNGFAGIWHLDEDPSESAPQMTDSTGNNYNGTSAGSMTSGDSVAGAVGNEVDFDGSNDAINMSSAPTLGSAFTIECLLRRNTSSFSDGAGVTYGKSPDTGAPSWGFLLHPNASSNTVTFYVSNGSSVAFAGSTTAWGTNTRHHVGGVYNNSTVAIRVNGVSEASAAASLGSLNNPAGAVLSLAKDARYTTRFSNCRLDELRWSSVERSAAWFKATSVNLKTPATFYSTAWVPSGPTSRRSFRRGMMRGMVRGAA